MTDLRASALRRFEAALVDLLEVHGERFTERSQVLIDRRPGVFVLSEADVDDGAAVRLMLAFDSRDPATYGLRLDR